MSTLAVALTTVTLVVAALVLGMQVAVVLTLRRLLESVEPQFVRLQGSELRLPSPSRTEDPT